MEVRINGVNVATEYGLWADRGFDSQLLGLPKRKPGYENNWPDENGIETDPLETPVFERITHTLPFHMMADSYGEFKSNYESLRALLLESGEIELDAVHLNMRFKLRYSDMSVFEKLSIQFGVGKIGVKCVIQFTNDYPNNLFTLGDPEAPTLSALTLNGSGHPILNWVEGDPGDSAKQGNRIQRRQIGGVWGILVTTNGLGTTFTDTTITPGTSYEYKVATRNLQGYSTYSNTRSLVNVLPEYDPPTATISIVGSNVKEYVGAGVNSQIAVNWSVTKKTKPIVTINVGGVEITPTGASQSGTTNINVIGNATPNFTISVSDGQQTVNASTPNIIRRHAIYYGGHQNPVQVAMSNAEILALNGKSVQSNRQLIFVLNANAQYVAIVMPVSYGTPTFKIDGFLFNAFTRKPDQNFTNAGGHTEPVQIWISNWVHSGQSTYEIL